MSLKAGTGDREHSRVPAPIRRRAKPHLLLVDSDLQIVHYESAALNMLGELAGEAPERRLPAPVETAVRAALERHGAEADLRQATVMPVPSLIIHISRVQGGHGSFFALLLERESRREPLSAAARRYALTKREREVLLLIIRGLHAADIAEELLHFAKYGDRIFQRPAPQDRVAQPLRDGCQSARVGRRRRSLDLTLAHCACRCSRSSIS